MEQVVFGSESSSRGCESGWTHYLEHSHKNEEEDMYLEEEEEDMSMVSDASSGPQHFPEQENNYNNNYNGAAYANGKRQKIPKEDSKQNPSFLDDTASSPLFNLSTNNNLTLPTNNTSNDYSHGYSTTYFKGKSAFEEHLGFFHPGAQLQQNQWLEGKRWA